MTDTKRCAKCGQEKRKEGNFNRGPWGDGYRARCRECLKRECKDRRAADPEADRARCRRWREANPERKKECGAAWYQANRETVKARTNAYRKARPEWKRDYDQRYYAENLEACRARQLAYYEANKPRFAGYGAKRKAAVLRAVPPWVDFGAIQRCFDAASLCGCESDHIIPLQGTTVCGLHWENNLQLLEKRPNLQKGNRVWPDMWDHDPEVARLCAIARAEIERDRLARAVQ